MSLGVAVVGTGNWGQRLVRALAHTPGAHVAMICDPSDEARARAHEHAPAALLRRTLEDALSDPAVDAVAIATPPASHAPLALAALRARRHVFVEKPMALTLADAETLIEAAASSERRLMVGHILEFHPAVIELRRRIADGELGEIRVLVSRRLGAGPKRYESAWWSLAPHDVSLTRYLLNTEIQGIVALTSSDEGLVAASLETTHGARAFLHLSHTSALKTRKVSVFGTRKIAVFDDVAPSDQKLRLFDVGDNPWRIEGEGELVITQDREPLRVELEHFVLAVRGESALRSDGESGARVVRVLEAGETLLRRQIVECGKMGPDSLVSAGK